MKHTWGPIRGSTTICGRCGLTRLTVRNPDSSTGWSTYYLPQDPNPPWYKKAPGCVDIHVPNVGQDGSTKE